MPRPQGGYLELMALFDTDRDPSGRWKSPGTGASGIRKVCDRTLIRYNQQVNVLLHLTDAETGFPLPMRPLLGRLGDRRRASASSRVSGGVR